MSETYNLYNLEAPFEEYLDAGNQKPISIKNYLSDVRHFFGWLILYFKSHKIQIESEATITQFITAKVISEYRSYLSENNIPHKTINRRLSTLRKFCSFCISQGWMKENPAKKIGNISTKTVFNQRQSLIKASESPEPSSSRLAGSSRLITFLRSNFSLDSLLRGNDKRRGDDRKNGNDKGGGDDKQSPPSSIIHDLSSNLGFQQYIAFLIILIFVSVMGAGIYNQFFVKNQASLAYPTTPTRAGRILSFQGRLTDTLSNPITTATNVVFQLYSVSSGGVALYNTGTCSTTPDQDGIFSSLIGSDCGSEIDASVFTENANVYLGITVGGDAEMTPRQQIANVGYAINSETLQGLPPGTGTSVIPYINVDGNLLISASAPGIRSTSTSTDFTLSSAKATVIQSAGTGDIVLQATESGTLKFRTGGITDAYTRISVDNLGNVGIGTTSPAQKLDVAGTAQMTGIKMTTSPSSGYVLTSDATGVGSWADVSSTAGPWTLSGSNLYPDSTAYNVGIGTTSPGAYKLNVAGNSNVTGTLNVTTSVSSPTFQGIGAAVTFGNASYGTTIAGSGLTVSPTAWTATPTISGLVTMTSGFDSNAASTVTALTVDGAGGAGDLTINAGETSFTSPATTANANIFYGNSLTSGNLLSLSSTSTALTTGSLASLDWSPGSSTTATGDLLSLNIGANGNIGNLFNVKDTGSSLFSVSETAVTSNLPTSFTSPGDVSIAYDLNFTNPTASYIKSAAPFYIQAGETFGSSDLTLKTYNSGDVVLDAAGGVTLAQAQAWDLADSSTTSLNIESGLMNFDTTNSRVGIGTTAPGAKLQVVSTNNGAPMTAGTPIGGFSSISSSGNYGLFSGVMGTGDYWFQVANGGSASYYNLLLQSNGGNVGIGTTSPTQKLDVAGTAQMTGFKMTTSPSSGYVLTSDAAGVGSWADVSSTAGPWTLSGVNLYPDSTSYNVGIGTTAPLSKLGVLGNLSVGATYGAIAAPTSGAIFEGNVGIGTTNPGAKLEINTGATGTIGQLIKGYSGQVANLLSIQNSSGTTLAGADERGVLFSDGGTESYSVYIGNDAGNTSTTGTQNTGVGWRALQSATTGGSNVAVGSSALRLLTTGASNTAIGALALTANTEGLYNTALGSPALYKNTTGSYNTAINSALYENTTGTQNTGIGLNAGRYITDGATANTTGDYNLFIGNSTKALADDDQNEIVIGYNTTGLGSNTVILGNSSIVTTALRGNVGIGTTAPANKLDVSGTAQMMGFKMTTSPSAGYILTSDATGVGSWADVSSTAGPWTLSGVNLYPDSTSYNVGIGTTSPLSKLGVLGNLSVGATYGAIAAPTSGAIFEGNVGIGTTAPGAMFQIKSGATAAFSVTSDGYVGINTNSFGSGYQRLEISGGVGIRNGGYLYLGNSDATSSLGINNSGSSGRDYLYFPFNHNTTNTINNVFDISTNSTGTPTTGFGAGILGRLESNTSNGQNAANITWYWTDATHATRTSNLAFATVLNGTLSNQMTITGTGNVGIGTTAPANKLDVAGTIQMTGFKLTTSPVAGYALTSDVNGVGSWTDVSSSAGPWTLSGVNLYPDSTSYNVGIGTTSPLSKLGVLGNASIGATYGAVAAPTSGLIVEGNVGIGTTAPGYKLDLVGSLGGSSQATTKYIEQGRNVTPWDQTFEENITGWNVINNTSFTKSSAQAYEGTYSFKIQRNDLTGGGGVSYTLGTSLKPGRVYTLSGYYKMVNGAGTAAIKLNSNGSSPYTNGTTYTDKTLTNASSWTFFSVSITASSITSGSNYVWLAHTMPDITQEIYFDNLVFSEGSIPKTELANMRTSIDGLYTYFGGNVGIGTTAPNTKLHIDSVGTGNEDLLTLENDYGGEDIGPAMKFVRSGSVLSRIRGVEEGTWDGGLAFEVVDTAGSSIGRDGATVEAMRINQLGNVGIGTTTPAQKLDVAGTAQMTGFKMTTSPSAGYILTSDATGVGSWADVSSTAGPWTLSGVNLYPDSTSYNVGIGTTAPLSKLGVLGNLSVGATYGAIAAPTSGLIVEGNVGIGTTAPSYKLHVVGNTYQAGATGANYFDAITKFGLNGTYSTVIDAAGNVGIGYTSVAGLAKLAVNGNVGIGTTGPNGTLDVVGDIYGVNEYVFSGYSEAANNWDTANLDTSPTSSIASDDSWYIEDAVNNWNQGLLSKRRFRRTPGLTLEWEAYATNGTGSNNRYMMGFASGTTTSYNYNQTPTNLIYQNNGSLNTYENGAPAGSDYTVNTLGGWYKFKVVLQGAGADYYVFNNGIWNQIKSTALNSDKYVRVLDSHYAGNTIFRNVRVYQENQQHKFDSIIVTGNVGIGTTAPLSKLGILGNLSVGATYGAVAAPTSGAIFEGNVGIGTTAPLAIFDVKPANSASPHIRMSNIGSDNSGIYAYSATPTHIYSITRQSSVVTADVSLSTYGGFGIATNATGGQSTAYKMYITTAGNVGIGTTAPSYKLDVNGSFRVQNNAMAIDASGYSTTPTTNTPWQVFTYSNPQSIFPNGDLESWTAGTSTYPDGFSNWSTAPLITRESTAANVHQGNYSAKIVSNATGAYFIGIGYFSPRIDKNPNDTSTATYTVSFWYKQPSTNTQTSNFGVYDTTAATYVVFDSLSKDDAWHFYSKTFSIRYDSNWYIRWSTAFGTATAGDTLYIDAVSFTKGNEIYQSVQSPLATTGNVTRWGDFYNMGGNVGIGTTAPAQKLDVAGTAQMTGFKMTTSPSAGYILTSDATGVGSWADVSSTAGPWTLSGVNLYPDSTSYNVGIGTTAPLSKLGVLGNLSVGATYGAIAAPTSGAIFEGNVGIGTTGPQAPLHVKGPSATEVVAARFSKGNYADTGGHTTFIGLGAETAAWSKSAIGHTRTASYDRGYLGFYTNNVTNSTDISTSDVRMVIDNVGNVGIGTTSPGSKLEVYKTGSSYTTLASFWNNTADGDPQITIGKTSVLASDTGIALGYDNAGNYGYLLVGGEAKNQGLVIANGGNVGIGTTGPGANLDISGGSLKLDSAIIYGPTNSGTSDVWFTRSTTSGIVIAGAKDWDYGVKLEYTPGTIGAIAGRLVIGQDTKNNANFTHGITSFLTNGSEKMRIDSSGNVGIGTTAPLAKLEIGSGNVAGANVGYSTGAPTLVSRFDGPKPDETDYTGNPNGSLGQVATVTGGVIFRPAKFGKGVQIAEATTNYVSNPSFETGLTGWSANLATPSQVSGGVYGSYAYQLIYSGAGDNYSSSYANYGSSIASKTFTFSFYAKRTAGSGTIYPYIREGGGAWRTICQVTTSLTTDWQRYTCTGTVPADSVQTQVNTILRTTGNVSEHVQYDGFQIEEKSYATPYADGSLGNGHSWSGTAHASTSSRTAASLTYPNPNSLINNIQGTIAGWVNLTYSTPVPRETHVLADVNPWQFYIVNGSSQFKWRDGVNDLTGTFTAWSANSWHYLVATWDSTGRRLYVDGVQVASTATPPAAVTGNTITVGNYYSGGGYELDGTTDDLAIFPSSLSAQEVYSIYKSNAPIQTEDKSSVLTASEILPVTSGGVSKLILAGSVAGNVGIGTTTPANKLDVAGTAQMTGFKMTTSPSLGYVLTSDATGVGSWADVSSTAGPWTLSGVNLYPDSTSYNVGIGTTAPTSKLEVIGTANRGRFANIRATGGIGGGGNSLFFGHSNTEYISTLGGYEASGLPFLSFYSYLSSTTNDTLMRASASNKPSMLIAETDGDLQFKSAPSGTVDVDITDWANTLVIKNSGSVGIGTTTPGSKLSSIGNLSVGATYGAVAAPTSGAIFEGNVGIGTTGPGAKLDVIGGKIRIESTDIDSYVNFSDRGFVGYDASANSVVLQGKAAKNLTFNVNNDTFGSGEAMRITSTGNVGIGTTAPQQKLDVVDSSAVTTYPLILRNNYDGPTSTSKAGIRFARDNGTPFAEILGGQQDASNYNYGQLQFRTRTTDALGVETKMTILANGNVGIGTTSPAQKLDVAGTAQMTGIKMTTSPAAGYVLTSDATGVGSWTDVSGSAGPWTLSGSNLYPDSTAYNVGIGTTAPGAYKLNVNGNSNVTGTLNVTTSVSSPTFQGIGAAVTFGNASYGTTIAGSGLTVSPTAWTATPTISGLVTMTSGFDSNTASTVTALTIDGTAGTGDLTINSGETSFTSPATTANANIFYGNSLTSGNLLSLSSTSTGLTTGSLASLDWSPGSALTATGDLLSLNIGANGNIGNLFNVKDTGSSLFSVSETAVTSNLPTSFTSSGDVSIAYDLNFTNPTASYIKSSAPFYIQAGETFNSSDLNLKTYNSGDVVLDAGGSTTGTGTVKFYDSNVKGATDTTPIGFAGASSDINTFRSNFTSETVIGSINEAYSAAVGGAGGLWLDGGTYAYPNTAYVTDVMVPSGKLGVGYSAVGASGVAAFNGNVGIGTTSPGALLQVGGSTATVLSNVRMKVGDGSATSAIQLDSYSDNNKQFLVSNANGVVTLTSKNGLNLIDDGTYSANMNFGVNNSTDMTILNGGSVGIGTTAPYEKLDISGKLLVNSASDTQIGGGIFLGNGANTRYWAVRNAATGNSFNIDSYNGGSIITPLTILQSGNVGIGTTSPSQNLHVVGNQFVSGKIVAGTGTYGATPFSESPYIFAYKNDVSGVIQANSMIGIEANNQDTWLSFLTSSSYDAGIVFGDESNAAIGKIAYDHGTNKLQFTTNGSIQATIDNNGNVGIGTTAPLSKLGILGNLSVGATYGAIAAPTSGAIFEGNVGIGTTGPGAKLDILSGSNMRVMAGSSLPGLANDNPTISLSRWTGSGDNYNTNYLTAVYNAASGGYGLAVNRTIGAHTIGDFDVNGAPATTAFFGYNGNVGIGTTAPGTTLHVAGQSTLPVIKQNTGVYVGTDITDDDYTRTVYFNIPAGGNSPPRYYKIARVKITASYQNISLNGYLTTVSTSNHVGGERKTELDFIAYAGTTPGTPAVTYLKKGPDTSSVFVYSIPDGGGAGTHYYDVYIKTSWYNDTNGELAIRSGFSSAVTVWQAGLDSGTTAPTDTLISPNSNYAFDTTGKVGIGTTAPSSMLSVGASSQFQVNSSGAIAAAAGVISSGNIDLSSLSAGGLVKAAVTTGRLSIATAGSDYENILTFSNGLTRTVNAVKLGGTLTATTDIPLGGYNLTFSGTGNVGIGTSAPTAGYKLDVNGAIIASKLVDRDSTTFFVDPADSALSLKTNSSIEVGNNITVSGGIIGTGSTATLILRSSGSTSVCVDTGAADCTGKIDAGTVDPPYTINGKNYATFLSAMIGVKEETTGIVTTTQLPMINNQSSNIYGYTIDFSNEPEASDLWLFTKVTNLKKQIDQMTVLLTPSENTRSWYKIDKENLRLYVYSSRPTNISYRLTAPRFDSENWSNRRADDAHAGFIINDQGNITGPASSVTYNKAEISPQDFVYDGNIENFKQSNSLFTLTGDFIDEFTSVTEALIARLKAGFIEAENIIVNNTLIAKNIVVDNIQIAGKNINQLIDERINLIISTGLINQTPTSINSPIIETDKVVTNEIKPKENDLIIDLNNDVGADLISARSEGRLQESPLQQENVDAGKLAKLIIKGLEGKTVTTIDSAGNASFSGQIIADSLQINTDASVAGTFTAQSSIINHLSSNDASISGKLIAGEIESSTINDIQKLLADIKNQPIPDANYYQNIDNRSLIIDDSNDPSSIIDHLSSNDLTVTGQSNLYNVSVSNSLLVGTTLFDQNSIISLASELKLSALAKINLFDGAVIIAKDGKITTRGEIIAKGGIRTDEIKPLTENGQVTINQLTTNQLSISDKYLEATTSASIIAAADNFDINGIFAPAIETATASAGIAILPENSSEVIIYNNYVKDDSLVYLTPTSDAPTNSQLTVGQKEICDAVGARRDSPTSCKKYFKVTSTPSTLPIKFNWLIVN